jgi:hypothetical protein
MTMKWWVALVAAMTAGGQAQAAIVTRSFNVTASKFNNFFGEAAPFAALSADFTISYDPAVGGVTGAPDFFRAVTDGQVNSGAFSAAPLAGYFPTGGFSRSPRIGVGGALNGISTGLNGTNDFYIVFDADDVRGGFTSVSFSTITDRVAFLASDAVVRETTQMPAVPEPSTWLMLLAGFGVTGAVVRRRGAAARNDRSLMHPR